jgi:hypothetical protein
MPDRQASTAARRWEITVLLGPCTDSEAERLMEDVADFVYARENYGACVAMHLDDDDVEAFALKGKP